MLDNINNDKSLKSTEIDILMAKLSNLSYKNIRKFKNNRLLFKDKKLRNWKYLSVELLKDKAFTAINYEDNQAVIVFKGSEPVPSFDIESIINDWCVSDMNLVVGKIPKQFYDAYEYYQEAKKLIPEDFSIFMTGHSLGGSLVQLLCSLDENTEIQAYTYNAYGIKHLIPCLERDGFIISKNFNNINNFSISIDIVSNHNEHIGNVFIVNYNKNFLQTISAIISELPKIATDIPFKVKKSVKYYFNTVKWSFIKINGHLMNNFTDEFNYKVHK